MVVVDVVVLVVVVLVVVLVVVVVVVVVDVSATVVSSPGGMYSSHVVTSVGSLFNQRYFVSCTSTIQ